MIARICLGNGASAISNFMPTIINSIHIIIVAFLFIIIKEARTEEGKNCFPLVRSIDLSTDCQPVLPRGNRSVEEMYTNIHH